MGGNAKGKRALRWLRRGVQILFFALVAAIVAANGLKEAGVAVPALEGASLHAICPFGGVVAFWNLATAGTLVKKVHESSVALAGIAIALAVLVGPFICGWICPLGSVQEWIGKLGRRLFKKRYNALVPPKIDKWLRYLRYIVLILVSVQTVRFGKLVFQDVDPYYALFNFWNSEVTWVSLAILGAVLALSLLVERPFCKYACPFGAFQGIFNLFRVFGIKRNPKTCISCHACNRACPMNIDVEGSGTVRDHQCISCMECTSELACPVADTVVLGAGSFKEKGGGK